ncbi:uncharacterized protein LOC131207003 [Anopheles bellator]|uniref:uncharacterized protein LOC131207003 n=1 Tax=Anopheles bellator TaxID=139047 RepID=UPI002647AB63|nr:uncharacterized protein LOC131207003 [Anopheles bellator]
MPDSDSSDDEVDSRLLQAVDSSFLNEALYGKKPLTNQGPLIGVNVSPSASKKEEPKSNRHLVEEETPFQSDLTVTESMQKHVAGKISKLIETIVTFDETLSINGPPALVSNPDSGAVRLLSGFDTYVDLQSVEAPLNRKPVRVRRRRVDDGEFEPNRQQKLQSAVCEPDTVAKELQHWKPPKRRSTVFYYKHTSRGLCEEIAHKPETEFSVRRAQNGWDESKIRSYKKRTKQKKGVKKTAQN